MQYLIMFMKSNEDYEQVNNELNFDSW